MACRVVRDSSGNIQYINSADGERSKLYDDILEHINSMSTEEINNLKDTFEPWINNKKLKSTANNELAFGVYERLRSPKGKQFLGDWETNGEQINPQAQSSQIEESRRAELLKPSPTLDTEEQGRVTDSIKNKVATLTPEQHQQIVNKLIEGESRRNIATELGLKNENGSLQNGLIDAVRNYYDIPTYTSPDYDAWQMNAQAINAKYDEQLNDISAKPAEKELNINTVKGLFEGNTVTPNNITYSATQKGLSSLIQTLFGGTEEQANESASLFDQQAKEWAERTGNKQEDYYKKIGFSNKLTDKGDAVYFSQEDLAKQKEDIKTKAQKTGTYLRAPNGKPTLLDEDQWLTTQTPIFKEWFGNSKAINENGEPKIFYHGAKSIWDTYDNEKAKKLSDSFRGQIYVSPEYEFAEDYLPTGKKKGNGQILSLFAKADNIFDYDNSKHLDDLKYNGPLGVHSELEESKDNSQNYSVMELPFMQEWLNKSGYDGFYVREHGIKNLGLYEPNQIKDATGKNQTFNKETGNIYFQGREQYQSAINDITNYLKLDFKKVGANFGGFVKAENGLTGERLAKRIGEVIDEKGYKDVLAARWDKTHNIVEFRPKDEVLHQDAKGAFNKANDVIYGLTNPDVTTFPHELAHAWEGTLTDTERKTVLDWAGHDEWSRETSEKFAKGFESFLAEGAKTSDEKVNRLFEKFAKWLADAYKGIKQSLGLELNDNMREVYSNMLNSDFVPKEAKETINEVDNTLKETPKPNSDYSIMSQQGIDGQNYHTIVDKQGNLVPNPEDEMGGFEDPAEAQAFADSLNPNETRTAQNSDIVEQPIDENAQQQTITAEKAPEYVKYKDIENGQPVEKIGIFKGTDGLLTNIQALDGTGVTKLTERVTPVSQDEGDKAVEAQKLIDNEPKGKYAKGTRVVYGTGDDAKQYTITGVEQREGGKTKKVNIGGVESTEDVNNGNVQTFYTTLEGPIIAEDGIIDTARNVGQPKILSIKQEQYHRNNTLTRIARRFERLFPDIESTIGDMNEYDENGDFVKYPFDAPARFYNGKVEVNIGYNDRKYTRAQIDEQNDPFNVPWLKRETVAHEYMHPFVLSMKHSNEDLYNKLVEDLKTNNKDVMDHVNKLVKDGNYEEKTKYDEGLAIYLGRELTKAFTKTGLVDEEYVKSRPLLERFVNWLKDVVDFLTGKKKPKSLEQFISDANNDKAVQKDNIRDIISNDDQLKDFTKKQDKIERKITTLKNNRDTVKELLNDDAKYNKLYDTIDTYGNKAETENNQFTFEKRENKVHYVEFDQTDPEHIKVYIDPKLKNEYSMGNLLLQYGSRIVDNDVQEAYDAHVKRNFYLDTKNAKNTSQKALNVKDLNPLMKLNDVSNLLINELGKDAKLQIKYTSPEIKAIDQLEAYMELERPIATRARKQIVAKFDKLKHDAEGDLKSEALKQNYNILNKLNNFTPDDADFVIGYVQQASTSINAAWRKFNEIMQDSRLRDENYNRIKELNKQQTLSDGEKEELADLKKTNSRQENNRLHRELSTVRQLVSFYDEFRNYNKIEYNFRDPEEAQQYANFQKSIGYIDAIKEGMNDAAINLTVGGLTDYVETHNKYVQKAGYTDDKYMLSAEKLRANLKYGTGVDTNYITYWLGTNVTSRDPLNAVVSNTLKDALSFNNFDITYDLESIAQGFDKHLTDKDISRTNEDTQTKYYKDNYLRKVQVLHREYDKITGDYKDIYVDKFALHQPYKMDVYDRDLINQRKKYENPRNLEESEHFDEELRKWKEDRNYGQDKRYANADFEKLKNDDFFQLLHKHYTDSNERFGEKGLKYGIIPQKYSESHLKQIKNLLTDVKAGKTAEEKYLTIKQKFRDQFAAQSKTDEHVNLDDSISRSISTTLTNIKDESNIDLNLADSMTEFMAESRHFNVLKQTQFSTETLLLLLEGNEKFNIKSRKFSQEDFTRKLNDTKALENARVKIKELDAARDNGEPVDEEYYNKVKERIAKGVEKNTIVDRFRGMIVPAKTDYNNDLLAKQLKAIYYGEGQEQLHVGDVNFNKMVQAAGLFTSVNNMAFNPIAGIANVATGNVQMFIEAHGGTYFNKVELGKATADYAKNLPNYIKDLQTPIKSKDTQLAFMLDAIQGEIHDEIGQRVTGNIARKMFRTNSLFLMTSLGEHQIQLTGMKAMLLGRKVETNAGENIPLYDAFIADKNGRYGLRNDVKFSQDDLAKFTRDLHGVNRELNGNYSDFNKTMLQRKWFGNLIIKFRKYIYPAFRARFASEHVDYERNNVDAGYLRYFFTKYLPNGLTELMHGRYGFSTKNLKPHELAAVRKTGAEIGIYLAVSLAAMGLAGTGTGKNKKELSPSEKFALLQLLRLRSDYNMYNFDLPDVALGQAPNPVNDVMRQLQSPTASLSTLNAVSNIFKQLSDPTAVYAHPTGIFEAGDSKLKAQMYKLIPGRQMFELFDGSFGKDVDNKLGYFNLTNQNVVGVTARPQAQ